MRTLLAVALALVPSCGLLEAEDADEGDPYATTECFRDLCVTPESPIELGTAARFGVGTEVLVPFLAHSTIWRMFDIVASDPSVLEVRSDEPRGTLTVRALRAGNASVIARTMTGEPLAERSLVTADIATIDFSWRAPPVASEPVTAIAGLAGAADSIGVAFRDAEGELLAGGAPVTVSDPEIASVIAMNPPWITADGFDDRLRFGLRFITTGTATATVTLFDGRTASLPIETVTAPDTLEVIFLRYVESRAVRVSGTADTDEILSATIVGRTADGRNVAGVSAAWTATSSVELGFGKDLTPEVQFQLVAPGAATITASVGGKLATAQLTGR
jgi:hypothetical protein